MSDANKTKCAKDYVDAEEKKRMELSNLVLCIITEKLDTEKGEWNVDLSRVIIRLTNDQIGKINTCSIGGLEKKLNSMGFTLVNDNGIVVNTSSTSGYITLGVIDEQKTTKEKKVVKINTGMCLESFPCSHPSVSVTYSDGSVENVGGLSGPGLAKLFEKHNLPIEEHLLIYLKK